ncbi:hypothetical protein [Arthrobacter pascens]|uniref:hypothetical protein n=1 Tax=Arthrobacter pascens TaxID=1677 RepID=UPI00196B064B|nr:hypothetical protein [Arthrobacter pascens]MBN3499190.1 hypothetical protein [Arthrobacter pascens]
MTAASYAPGSWFGILRSGTAVILGPESQPALVRKVWDLLQGAPEVHEVLHAVTGGLGVPLSRCPQFGIIGFRESLRVFLRGELELSVQLPTGTVKLDGRNVTTWTERWLDSPEWFSLAVPGVPDKNGKTDETGRPAATDLELPVAEGVVLLQSLRLAVAGTGTAGTGTAAAALAAAETSAETLAAMPAGAGETVSDETRVDAVVPEEPLLEEPQPDEPQADEPVREDDGNPGDLPQPASELTSSYDHLWDKTVVRSIEGAAVRTGEDAEEAPMHGAAAASQGAADIPDAAESPEAAAQDAGAEQAAASETGLPAAGPEAGPPAVPASGPAAGGLIDSVPWATRSDNGQRPPAPPSFIPLPDLGTTAAPEPQPGQGQPETPARPAEGDHDGQTVLKSELRAAPDQPPAASGAAPGGGPLAGGPLVLARVCAAGHANPPTNGQCSTCGSPLPDVAVQVPRPRLGQVRLSTGEVIGLEESLVIGRQPSVSRVQGGAMPRLVQVASPGGDISRSHIEVRLEGWHVMLCDLKATNGTVLVREGQPPRRLAQNEMAIVLDGDVAELGDDVSLRFEEIL